LSVYELTYLLSKLKVSQLMTAHVETVKGDTPIEQAAQRMVEHRIGGMPVVDDHQHVVGVITETDIFRAFVEMLGTGQPGVRVMLRVPAGKGVLAKLTKAIFDLDGNIVSVGTFGALDGIADAPTEGLLVKVTGVRAEQLVSALEALGDHVLDIRSV
jgi:acetoin utilization protein AcuB